MRRLRLPLRLLLLGFAFSTLPTWATVYDAGVGTAIPDLNGVPWTKLLPGDTVQIHPGTYARKIILSQSGTPAAPISVVGIRDAAGALPVIDATNATSQIGNSASYAPLEAIGLILVTRRLNQPGVTWLYEPSNIVISGLDVRGATPPNTFTDSTGMVKPYGVDASGINLVHACNITVKDCEIHGCSDGLFENSNNGIVSKNLLVDHCYFHDNGVVGSYLEHESYTEGIGTTFQFCHYGANVKGSQGGALKDRSAGTLVRYCTFDGGTARLLDLVEAQGTPAVETADPAWANTFVYGNCFHAAGAIGGIFHFGYEWAAQSGRKNLYFYHNTLVTEQNQTGAGGAWSIVLFDTSPGTTESIADSIFFHQSAAAGQKPSLVYLSRSDGALTFTNDWVSPGWLPWGGAAPTGTQAGTASFLSGTSPGFIDMADGNYGLAAGSPCISAAGPLPLMPPMPDWPPFALTSLDLGGLAPGTDCVNGTLPLPPVPPVPPPPPPAIPTGVSALAGDGTAALSWTASAGATSYHVFRALAPGGENIAAPVATVTTPAYSDAGLTDGTTYFYQVSGVSAMGVSAPSAEVSATPAAPPPPPTTAPSAPTGLTGSVMNGTVSLTWQASAGAASYRVRRSLSAAGTFTVIATVAGTAYADAAVTRGTTFYYVVNAVNSIGVSDRSNAVSVTP